MPESPMSTSLSIATEKSYLRQQALTRRKEMRDVERIEYSLALVEHFDALPLPEGGVVAGFWPIRDEIDPRPLMDKVRQAGHPLCLPVVAEPHLQFRRLERGAEMVPAGFGTLAPGPEADELRPDVLLMPLAAFDSRGERIGYGKGHYDTAIAALGNAGPLICIGLAFGIQEVDRVPTEAHDKRLDGILTERGYRSFG